MAILQDRGARPNINVNKRNVHVFLLTVAGMVSAVPV